jgi:hypothetical protein
MYTNTRHWHRFQVLVHETENSKGGPLSAMLLETPLSHAQASVLAGKLAYVCIQTCVRELCVKVVCVCVCVCACECACACLLACSSRESPLCHTNERSVCILTNLFMCMFSEGLRKIRYVNTAKKTKASSWGSAAKVKDTEMPRSVGTYVALPPLPHSLLLTVCAYAYGFM